jgi:ABC-2 type transport system ATP-binding protein
LQRPVESAGTGIPKINRRTPINRGIGTRDARFKPSRGALRADPEILILDEPANGLEPEGVRWLRGFAAEGGTVLVSSHMLAETAQTVDSVVIVDHGRLVRQDRWPS